MAEVIPPVVPPKKKTLEQIQQELNNAPKIQDTEDNDQMVKKSQIQQAVDHQQAAYRTKVD